jgi:hypothetical protein
MDVKRDKGKFTKGNALGRPKGLENKTTKEARELFISIMEGEVDKIKASLDTVRKQDAKEYLDVLSKFFPYFIPKKVEIDTPNEIIVNVKRKS